MSSRYTRKRGPKPKPKTNTKPTKSRVQPKHVSKPGPRRRISAVNNVRGWRDIMAFEAKAAENRHQTQYQTMVQSELKKFANRANLAYQISKDPRQQKANEVMREMDPGHVDMIYTEEDLRDIEDMFGPFSYGTVAPAVNPMQVQLLRERIEERKAQNREPKKRQGTLKARKHAGQGTGF
jgi:hypothetical protein